MKILLMSSNMYFKSMIGCFHAPIFETTCKSEVKTALE
jgi:hypothetical protein